MTLTDRLTAELDQIRKDGLFKDERVITSMQSGRIEVGAGRTVLNFCANNYLGLANRPELATPETQAELARDLLRQNITKQHSNTT